MPDAGDIRKSIERVSAMVVAHFRDYGIAPSEPELLFGQGIVKAPRSAKRLKRVAACDTNSLARLVQRLVGKAHG